MSNRRKQKRKEKKPSLKIGKRVVKSDFEYNSYIAIKANLPKRAEIEYETEKLDYIITRQYIPDLIITFKDGRKIYIECKGYFPYSDREKMIAVKQTNPSLDIRLLFYGDSPSKLGKGSKTKPSEWAQKHGFLYAIGEIPADWLLEQNDG